MREAVLAGGLREAELFTLEEIFRTDLAEVVLRMAELGIRDFEGFDFISPPDRASIAGAVETLKALDALDPDLGLSETGRLMAAFPILPRLSRIIVEALRRYPDVLEEALTAVAFLSTPSVFLLPPGEELEARRAHHRFRDPWGDLVSYLRIFERFKRAPSRTDFCRDSYLDERTLFEIANVKEQLGQIVSDMGIPLTGGGSVQDYLCALSAGLIQFVCARSGRGTYRSPTAERIQIHPGSVMFREEPEFIVAGEIVRTGRTYARSVSPLTRALVARVAPELLGPRKARRKALHGERRDSAAAREPAARDFTNRIKIGHELFEVRTENGKKKTVILPWEKLEAIAGAAESLQAPGYRNLRARITFQGYEVLAGAKLTAILAQASRLPMAKGVLTAPYPRRPLRLPEDAPILREWVPHLAELCPMAKGSGKGDGRARKLGFLTLVTEGSGAYRLRASKGLRGAVSESIAALEAVADEDEKALAEADSRVLDEAYRRLSALVG